MWKLIVFNTLGHRCRRLTRIVNVKEQLFQTFQTIVLVSSQKASAKKFDTK